MDGMPHPFRENTPRPVIAAQLVLLGGLTLLAAHALLGLGGSGASPLLDHWLYDGLMVGGALVCLARAVLVREERAAWSLIGAGLLMWSFGDVYWTAKLSGLQEPPIPSLSDLGYLAFYPLLLAGIALLARARMERIRATVWLDGLITALALTTVGAEVLLAFVFRNADVSGLRMVVSLAYPIGDTLLLSFAAALLVITGRLPGRAWGLIVLGLSTNALADAIYSYQVYIGSYVEGGWLDLFWPLGAIALAAAAWQPGQRIVESAGSGWRAYLVPGLFAAVITVRLLLRPFLPLNGVAEFVVALMLMVIVARFIVALAENQRLLRRVETEPLTGLGTRGKLLEDLRSGLIAERPQLLTLFDLDGFKAYNDTFGHPAGDAMLARLGGRLAASLPEGGTAYRIGGDEFCILVPAAGGPLNGAIERAAAALTEHGSGFVVTSSYGTAALPNETEDPLDALQLADRRMYEQKESHRVSAGGQAKDVLLQALGERQPLLEEHVRSVSKLATAVGERMDLDPGELVDLSRAAELHDIGKMAIPDAILDKPGPLNEEEWTFMKQHTVLGEGIIASAPALTQVASIVRSTHERFDGDGYPDGLAGEEIPLTSRIIFACDAFDAMTSERTYAVPHSDESAIDELHSCAGSQFDPTVVETLCQVLRERGVGEDIAGLEQALRAS